MNDTMCDTADEPRNDLQETILTSEYGRPAEEDSIVVQNELDPITIMGNPYKTALCFPTAAEFKRLNWRALIVGVAWWFFCFYIDCVLQVTTEVCVVSFFFSPVFFFPVHLRFIYDSLSLCTAY